MSELRLAPKVTVDTITKMASEAPRIAERTGTASRAPPGSRAKRTPVMAGAESPEEATARATADGRSLAWACRAHPLGGQAHGEQQRHRRQDDDEHEEPSPSTVQSQPNMYG